MKAPPQILFLAVVTFSLALAGCDRKCGHCTFVEEDNGVRYETPLGKFCDDEYDQKVDQVLNCSAGSCYNECVLED